MVRVSFPVFMAIVATVCLLVVGGIKTLAMNPKSSDRLTRALCCMPGLVGVLGEKSAFGRNARQSAPTSSFIQLPIPGKSVTSVFGWRLHPIFHRRIFHDGVDFAASAGDKVHCVLDGFVRSAGPASGYGNAVFIYHPSSQTTTMYAHLSRAVVKSGQPVRQGTVIGLAGATGYATGVHLHFGVRNAAGGWINPMEFLRKVPAFENLAMQREAQSKSAAGKLVTLREPMRLTAHLAGV